MAMYVPGPSDAGQYIQNTNAFDVSTSYTASAWVYMPTATPGPYAGQRAFVTLGDDFFMGTASDSRTFMVSTSLYVSPGYNGSFLPITQWFHVAMTLQVDSPTSQTLRGYLNGKLDVEASDSSPIAASSALFIGNWNATTPLNGNIEDVRFWTRALKQDEIIEEMRSSTPVNREQLYCWLSLKSSLTNDDSGNGAVFGKTASVALRRGRNANKLSHLWDDF